MQKRRPRPQPEPLLWITWQVTWQRCCWGAIMKPAARNHTKQKDKASYYLYGGISCFTLRNIIQINIKEDSWDVYECCESLGMWYWTYCWTSSLYTVSLSLSTYIGKLNQCLSPIQSKCWLWQGQFSAHLPPHTVSSLIYCKEFYFLKKSWIQIVSNSINYDICHSTPLHHWLSLHNSKVL